MKPIGFFHGLAWAPLGGLVMLGLSACGGDGRGDDAGAGIAGAEPARVRPQQFAAGPTPPLLDDHGVPSLSTPGSVPQDGAAQTRAGRYATAQQADELARALGSDVLWVQLECCGIDRTDEAVAIAHGLQAAHDLPDSAPMLVRGSDLRLAAAVADRLADRGHTQVWLVTR